MISMHYAQLTWKGNSLKHQENKRLLSKYIQKQNLIAYWQITKAPDTNPTSKWALKSCTLSRVWITFTVGKPCWSRSLTEPRLPSVRYRARCWVSGWMTIFSSLPSFFDGYCIKRVPNFCLAVWGSSELKERPQRSGLIFNIFSSHSIFGCAPKLVFDYTVVELALAEDIPACVICVYTVYPMMPRAPQWVKNVFHWRSIFLTRGLKAFRAICLFNLLCLS